MPLDSGGRPADALEAATAEGPLPTGSTSVSRRMFAFETSQKGRTQRLDFGLTILEVSFASLRMGFNEGGLGQMSR